MAGQRGWRFVSNHLHVLMMVWQTPDVPVRVIAERVGITERAAHRILAQLVAEGFLSKRRVGRGNFYFVSEERRLRHPELAEIGIMRLINALTPERKK
jgi:DNA-binding MarR family transcriptional regulator